MRLSEQKLYEQEAVIRPNRYVEIALTILSFFIIWMLLGNETGFFQVAKARMRFGAFASLAVLEIPLITVSTERGIRSKNTKYLMIACAEAVSLLLSITLSFHSTLILVLPMLLSAQYPSRKLCMVTVVCSFFVAFFAPLISFELGLWDTAFLSWLCSACGLEILADAVNEVGRQSTGILKIALYLSCPHSMTLLAFSPLAFSIASGGEKRLENQIRVLHMSQSDSLTGVFNRLTFDQLMAQNEMIEDANVAVVYVDANDLHRINNDLGHIAGDQMLICVAESLQESFGNESVYRIGGDEFVCILHGLTLAEVRSGMTQAQINVEQHGYSIAHGMEYAQPPCTLPALITSAETKMQLDKSRYHLER